jgi:predicted Zn finger-like uncharacterized protein
MIIECIKCNKKFELDSELIPDKGRTVQCGSCNTVWFFDKKKNVNQEISILSEKSSQSQKDDYDINDEIGLIQDEDNFKVKKKIELKNINNKVVSKKDTKSNFKISNYLSVILIMIISFIALILVLDTFKNPLYKWFPYLELVLYNLYETLIDVNLFVKDLI